MTGKQLLSAGAVAKILGVNRATVWRWCEAGKLPAFRTPGGQWRIRAVDVARMKGR
jgi:excisionase family DNA binding protein